MGYTSIHNKFDNAWIMSSILSYIDLTRINLSAVLVLLIK